MNTKSCLRDEQFVNAGQCYAYTRNDYIMMLPTRLYANCLRIKIL